METKYRFQYRVEINFERATLNIDFQWEMQFPPFVTSKPSRSPSRNKDSRGHIKVRKRRRFIFPWPNICFSMKKLQLLAIHVRTEENPLRKPKESKECNPWLEIFLIFCPCCYKILQTFFPSQFSFPLQTRLQLKANDLRDFLYS